MITGKMALAAAKGYTDDSLQGAGAVAGKPCTIKNIDKVNKTNTVTFEWTKNDGSTTTSQMTVLDGADPNEIVSLVIDTTDNHLKATMSDATTIDCGEMPIEEVKVSADAGNAVSMKADGLYVATTGVSISAESGNTLENKTDGLYVPATDISGKVDKVTGKGLSTNDYDATEKAEVAKVKDKIDKNQGAANAGKSLIVGADGTVTLGTVATDGLEIVDKTLAEYNALTDAEKNDATKLYNITDADDLDLTSYAKQSDIDAVTSYSTNETVVATWIDGKPIYKKTYVLTNTTIQATTWTDLFDIPNNINKLIKTETIGNCSSTTKGYCVTSPYMCISNQTKISVYSPYLMGIEIVTLWYTKTTD